MRRIVVGIGLALLCAGAHAECLKANVDGQVAEGKLSSSVFTTPAYNLKEQAYLVTLAKPACLDGDDEYDKVEKSMRIHVYSADDKLRKQMRALVGKTVQVHGSPFGEVTAHHHAPIVMGISAIEAVKKR